MGFMATVSAEAGWVQTMSRRLRIFKLAIKQNPSWGRHEGCVDLSCPGDKPVQLESQKCTASCPAPFGLRQADHREELFQPASANLRVLPTVRSQLLSGLAKGDGLLAL